MKNENFIKSLETEYTITLKIGDKGYFIAYTYNSNGEMFDLYHINKGYQTSFREFHHIIENMKERGIRWWTQITKN